MIYIRMDRDLFCAFNIGLMQGPPVPFALLSPLLLEVLESVSNGIQQESLVGKAVGLLEEGLAKLTDLTRERGLSQEFVELMCSFGHQSTRNEAQTNAAITRGILLPLIDGFCILNASYEDEINEEAQSSDKPLFLPSRMGWKGLALGK